MKYIIFLFSAAFLMSGCAGGDTKTENKTDDTASVFSAAAIQIYYFHGERRCPSCIAIGEQTEKVLLEEYSDLVKAGTIAFSDINVDEEKNFALAEKYQIAGSALLIVKTTEGKEEIADLTGDGFKLARNMPEMFRSKVIETINQFNK
jgi:hypothetical protein